MTFIIGKEPMKYTKLSQKNLLKSAVLITSAFLTSNVLANSIHTIEPVKAQSINTNAIIELAKVDIDNLLAENTLVTLSAVTTEKVKLAAQSEALSPQIAQSGLIAQAE